MRRRFGGGIRKRDPQISNFTIHTVLSMDTVSMAAPATPKLEHGITYCTVTFLQDNLTISFASKLLIDR